jgi:tungstate transport system substrate-binding protein
MGPDLIRTVALGCIAAFAVVISSAGCATAQEKSIVVASTTSTNDTGLFEHLLPLFTMKTGIAVKVLAVGTGQALDIARRGDADVVFVHNKSAEQTFVAEGHGVKRNPVMYNDFVGHVCFTPESGHVQCTSLCLLWAKSGISMSFALHSH